MGKFYTGVQISALLFEVKVVFYLNVVSPHQLPLAEAVVRRVGASDFAYVYSEEFLASRKAMGWSDENVHSWCIKGDENSDELMEADLVYTGIRCTKLMKKRLMHGKKTLYSAERWFKPIAICGRLLPGEFRLFSARYRRMVSETVPLLNDDNMKCLPCGPWAAKDLQRVGVAAGQIVPWGYFVAPGKFPNGRVMSGEKLKVLWVGGMSRLKRVDSVIRAVAHLGGRVELTLVGDGPEKAQLVKTACGLPVVFYPYQPINIIREIMRRHDAFVFASNGMDGWGAVVNEALEEGMYVIGTRETGASAAMLPDEALYNCGDWHCLARILSRCCDEKRAGMLKGQGIGDWTADKAAEALLRM